jgi:hypothetical protein
VIQFTRPNTEARRGLFEQLLEGVDHNAEDIAALVNASERNPPFSYSDLVERGAEAALMTALRADQPVSAALLLEAIEKLEPSPLIESAIR